MQRRLVGNAERRSQVFLARTKQLRSRSPGTQSLLIYDRQPAGITKDSRGPIERNGRKPFQQLPGRCVRDVEVFIIRSRARLPGREADAATKSRDGQSVESINLKFGERINLVIGRDHSSSSTDRIALIEHDVSQRDGQVA